MKWWIVNISSNEGVRLFAFTSVLYFIVIIIVFVWLSVCSGTTAGTRYLLLTQVPHLVHIIGWLRNNDWYGIYIVRSDTTPVLITNGWLGYLAWYQILLIGSGTTPCTYLIVILHVGSLSESGLFVIMWDMLRINVKSRLVIESLIVLLTWLIVCCHVFTMFTYGFIFISLELGSDPTNTLWFAYWYCTCFFFVKYKTYSGDCFVTLTMSPELTESKGDLPLLNCHGFLFIS